MLRDWLSRVTQRLGHVRPRANKTVEFREGECWAYRARTQDRDSFLVIRRIENRDKIGEVVHISIFNVNILNQNAPDGYAHVVGHMPILGTSMRQSLEQPIQRAIPDNDWLEGYEIWCEAFESGKGGVFAEPVNVCVDLMEHAINHGKKS